MQRRAFLLWVVAGATAWPARGLRIHAQAITLPSASVGTLRALAPVLLPSILRPAGHEKVVNDFVQWLASYRAGAERSWGYGSPRRTGTSAIDPARYAAQLTDLANRARNGSRAFADLPIESRRELTIAWLDATMKGDLPSSPNGANVVADFMSFFYSSGPAHDLAYGANIRRATCRGLAGSAARPTSVPVGD
jgi:hypothetical protein